MFHMPQEVLIVLSAFAPLFSKPVWNHATTLAIGSILSTGKRTVTSALNVMGLREEKQFTNFHRVLNRAKWSSLKGAKNTPRPSCPFNSRQPALDHCFGLKWIAMMLVVPVPWTKRAWALPFLTVLAPSKASNDARHCK